MCLSPIHIPNKSSYIVDGISYSGYDVPCGHCLECQQQKRNEWQTRIAFELSSLYARRGCAVFLTFTYNEAHLPSVELDFGVHGKEVISCFRHSDVLSFLNRLKVEAHKCFGPNSYKYFFTSEYGSNTKRPHYHAIFFLQPFVDWHKFVEMCRAKWSFGYMFPKYDKYRNMYVDNDSQPLSHGKPCISSLGGCAKYVSKYVTKDLSFYELPSVSQYLSVKGHKDLIKTSLPKHWQSNCLGWSAIDDINLFDDNDVKQVLSVGLLNPLTFKRVPLPSYVINKLMYRNVKSDRISPTSGKPLYDRYLTDFGAMYQRYIFETRIFKTACKMSETLQDVSQYDLSSPCLNKYTSSQLRDYKTFLPHAFYRVVYMYLPSIALDNILSANGGDISSLYNLDFAFNFWLANRDTKYLKAHVQPWYFPRAPVVNSHSFFRDIASVVSLYDHVCILRDTARCEENERRLQEIQRYKRLYTNKYDNTLC